MPRIQVGGSPKSGSHLEELADELAEELRQNRPRCQPRIEEETLPANGAIRVTVFWDNLADLSDPDRIGVIRRAYNLAESEEFQKRITLVLGLTVPEAYGLGMLPYEVMALLRKGDPVTEGQCRDLALGHGGSTAFGDGWPHLLFGTEAEAVACRESLIEALPAGKAVWAVRKQLTPPSGSLPEFDE